MNGSDGSPSWATPNTASMNGLIAFGTFAAYSGSKFAVTGMSEALRDELAPFDVGASILFPGLTRSRMSLGDADAGFIPREVMEAGMMEPIWLGRAVVRAIEENNLYIVSHPEHRPQVEERVRNVLAAFAEPAQIRNGNMVPPQKPGLGLEIPEEIIQKYRVE